jgi:hypothetical protein
MNMDGNTFIALLQSRGSRSARGSAPISLEVLLWTKSAYPLCMESATSCESAGSPPQVVE